MGMKIDVEITLDDLMDGEKVVRRYMASLDLTIGDKIAFKKAKEIYQKRIRAIDKVQLECEQDNLDYLRRRYHEDGITTTVLAIYERENDE